MPSETIGITKDQRDALYGQVRTHLAALGDIWIALEGQKGYATAERLAFPLGWMVRQSPEPALFWRRFK